MSEVNKPPIQLIPIEKIKILNPRVRNKKKFQEIISNISNLGLKKPITVSKGERKDGDEIYYLVCGQGRLEAYESLGQSEVPAIIIDVSRMDCFLMSLVENLARRKHNSIELLHEIEILNQRGYNFSEIAKKTDLSTERISGILQLINHGEERLLKAVEKREIPISIAIEISNSEDHELQQFFHEAYESKNLRGRALIKVRRIIEQRRTKGKALGRTNSKLLSKELTAASLVRIYRQETDRQKLMVKKAKLCEARLTFIISALKELFSDENYVNLLRAESIDSLPKNLANQLTR